jgi:hypothetical protein
MESNEIYRTGLIDGIGHGESIYALAMSMAMEGNRDLEAMKMLIKVREIYTKLCAEKKADLKPQTEKI